MTPATSSKKGNKRYRYYVCISAQKRGWHTCPSKSVPAAEIERFVIEQIRGQSTEHFWIGADVENLAALSQLPSPEGAWEALSVREQASILRRLVNQVTYDGAKQHHTNAEHRRHRCAAGEHSRGDHRMTTIETTFHFGRGARTEKRLCVGVAPVRGRIPRVAQLMALAIQCDDLLKTAAVQTLAQLATLGHVSRTRMTHIMNLMLLAPKIQERLLHLPRVLRPVNWVPGTRGRFSFALPACPAIAVGQLTK